jgi:hypothetical protein
VVKTATVDDMFTGGEKCLATGLWARKSTAGLKIGYVATELGKTPTMKLRSLAGIALSTLTILSLIGAESSAVGAATHPASVHQGV